MTIIAQTFDLSSLRHKEMNIQNGLETNKKCGVGGCFSKLRALLETEKYVIIIAWEAD